MERDTNLQTNFYTKLSCTEAESNYLLGVQSCTEGFFEEVVDTGGDLIWILYKFESFAGKRWNRARISSNSLQNFTFQQKINPIL